MTGKHAPRTSIKQSDTNKSSGVRKQWIRLEKIIWPVAPDGYIPNSVVRSLAPYPVFNNPCANRGLQIKEQIEDDDISAEQKRMLKYFLEKYGPSKEEQQNKEDEEISLKHGKQSVPEETNITAPLQNKSEETKTRASLTPYRRAVPQSQFQNRQKSLQQNASSVDDLQMKDSSVDVLQMNATSVEEQKKEEDGEKDQSNAFSSEQPKKVKKGQKASFKLAAALSPELHQEMVSTIKEQEKRDSTDKSVHVLAPKRTVRQKTDSRLKKLKSFVSPLPLLGNRKPNSVLIYLYKRSKGE